MTCPGGLFTRSLTHTLKTPPRTPSIAQPSPHFSPTPLPFLSLPLPSQEKLKVGRVAVRLPASPALSCTPTGRRRGKGDSDEFRKRACERRGGREWERVREGGEERRRAGWGE